MAGRHPQDSLERLRLLAHLPRITGTEPAEDDELGGMLTTTNTGRHAEGFHGARMGGPANLDEMIAAVRQLEEKVGRVPSRMRLHPDELTRFAAWLRFTCPASVPTADPSAQLLGITVEGDDAVPLGELRVYDQRGEEIKRIDLPWRHLERQFWGPADPADIGRWLGGCEGKALF